MKLKNIRTHATSYVFSTEDSADAVISEATVSVNWSTVRRIDMEPATCGDPGCTNDHGFTGMMVPDDFTIRVSAEVEGRAAIEKFELFIEALSSALTDTCMSEGLTVDVGADSSRGSSYA